MYDQYFGLKENPFSLTPDPRFLYMSERHREALAHLMYGMGIKDGFVLLTGEVGTGKTTLCRTLLEQIPEAVDVAFILNPKQTAFELVGSICDELKIAYPPETESLKVLIDLLNRHLLAAHAEGRRIVLIIDEAQNLSMDVLEQVRLLTNLETPARKLLQILLIGQPELRKMMARPELRQLSQRITARYHLTPLKLHETKAYVLHRLEKAGSIRNLFTSGALRRVQRFSRGIPRLINIVCDRALLGGYAAQTDKINRSIVRKAVSEVSGEKALLKTRGLWISAAAILFLGFLVVLWRFLPQPPFEGPPPGKTENRVSEWAAESIFEANVPEEIDAIAPVTAQPVEGLGPVVNSSAADTTEMGAEPAPEETPDNTPGAALAGLLAGGEVDTATDTAFAALFGHWGEKYQGAEGVTACDRAAALGLRCFKGRGNWTTLIHYNRPAVLELVYGAHELHHVVVAKLDERTATLDFGGWSISFPRAEVESLWFGDFIILWKPPRLGSSLLKKGSSGPDVRWLMKQLARAEGGAESQGTPAGNPVFDEKLKTRIMRFQAAQGLRPDGIVGEETLIRLNAAAGDSDVPLLWQSGQ